jgi:hypothetical protein
MPMEMNQPLKINHRVPSYRMRKFKCQVHKKSQTTVLPESRHFTPPGKGFTRNRVIATIKQVQRSGLPICFSAVTFLLGRRPPWFIFSLIVFFHNLGCLTDYLFSRKTLAFQRSTITVAYRPEKFLHLCHFAVR